jgi:nitroimidazol reductase NimA-like FMN-containing flavoprotein (pyridoxamine 5'-phosphate oxidase superfamily)
MAVGTGADADAALDEVRAVVAANAYMTLATADGDGRPWATPVWFAPSDLKEFVWVSRPGARHSRNIATRPAVGIAIFDSTVAVGGAAAVYVEAEAAEVAPGDRAAALAVYNVRTQEQDIGSWDEQKVVGDSQFRLYRARASRVYVLDEHDGRVEVF